MPSSPRAYFFFLHWPDSERWSPYVSSSSWCSGNACSAVALSHLKLTKPSVNLSTAGPLCCILFSQWVVFPLQLGKDLKWGQKKAFCRFCLGNYVYIWDFQLLKDSLEQHLPARDTAGVTPESPEAPRQWWGQTDRQVEILFIGSFRHHLQLQPCLSFIWTTRNKGGLLVPTKAVFVPLPCARSWCASAQILTCGLLVVTFHHPWKSFSIFSLAPGQSWEGNNPRRADCSVIAVGTPSVIQ